MTSGSNNLLHNDPAAYAVSQNVNSKVHFARNAPGFGIPVPDTLVTTKGALKAEEAAAFAAKHDNKLVVKTLGLGGARTVMAADSLQASRDYVAEFDDDMDVILQQRLDLTLYRELTADLIIKPDSITLSGVRGLLFTEDIWVGSLMSPDIAVTEEQHAELMKIGDYVRAQGYVAPEGLICGVDFFVAQEGGEEDEGETPFIAIELNCRWTVGLYSAEIIRRAGAADQPCIAMINLVEEAEIDPVLDFMDQHLYSKSEAGFGLLPVGFSPIPQVTDGKNSYYFWLAVAGDFEAFKRVRNARLGAHILNRADATILEN
jgi:hypothetical protein